MKKIFIALVFVLALIGACNPFNEGNGCDNLNTLTYENRNCW